MQVLWHCQVKGGCLIVKLKVPILLLFVLFFSFVAHGEGELNPAIDLANGYITVEGTGVMPKNIPDQWQGIALARLAAKVDAQRNLLEIIAGLKLNGETSMINLMANDVVRTEVAGILQGAYVVPGSEYFQQGIYRLQLRVKLTNLDSLLKLSLDKTNIANAKIQKYSGLVIDATGLGITAPEVLEIRDTRGNLIYTSNRPSAQPIPLLKMDKEQALSDPRVGSSPLMIKAVKIGASDGSILIVADENGQTILSELEGTDVFLLTKIVVFLGGSKQ